MAEALALRRAHLQQLGSLLRRRIEVNTYTVGTLGRSDTTQGSASSHASKLLQVLHVTCLPVVLAGGEAGRLPPCQAAAGPASCPSLCGRCC